MNIQITRILFHFWTRNCPWKHIITTHPKLITKIKHSLLPMRFSITWTRWKLTSFPGKKILKYPTKACKYSWILSLQCNWCNEVEILLLHCIDIKILRITGISYSYKNTAFICDLLSIRHYVYQWFKQSNLFDRIHLESVNIIPNLKWLNYINHHNHCTVTIIFIFDSNHHQLCSIWEYQSSLLLGMILITHVYQPLITTKDHSI